MKTLSLRKLAQKIKFQRENLGYTQSELGKLTNINRIMIGRIEKETYTPSIEQLEAISKTLAFDPTEMFVNDNSNNSFVALRSETLGEQEQKGVETLFSMMLAIRKQIQLRSSFINEEK